MYTRYFVLKRAKAKEMRREDVERESETAPRKGENTSSMMVL